VRVEIIASTDRRVDRVRVFPPPREVEEGAEEKVARESRPA
jgi:hypothetical protein